MLVSCRLPRTKDDQHAHQSTIMWMKKLLNVASLLNEDLYITIGMLADLLCLLQINITVGSP